MRTDYQPISVLAEWKDIYRLKVYTESLARFLLYKTGKVIPPGSVVKLTCDELMRLHTLINDAKVFTGLYGPYEDELKYDYIFNKL
jgi:hypothetical protein